MKALKKFFKNLGPGFVAGAADNDPSGIATYSQTGAQFGYTQLWTALFMLPFLIAIQEASGRLATVTGKGITTLIAEKFSRTTLYFIVTLVLIANIINISADLGSMAAATELFVGLNHYFLIFLYASLITILQVRIPYAQYEKFLKWLGLFLLVYPITLFMMKQPWLELLKATFIPHMQFDFAFLFIITGVFGTTITPYVFLWQAEQIVEEKISNKQTDLIGKKTSPTMIKRLRIDSWCGMIFSEITTWSIIVVGATALHANGVTNIKSASDAAKALAPLVNNFPNGGRIAEAIFSIGIVGLGLLSIPVLAGSSAYAVNAIMKQPQGLGLTFGKAKGFYGVIIFATLLGAALNMIGINPFKALIYSAVLNGIVAVPLIFLIGVLARDKAIMYKHRIGVLSTTLISIIFVVMTVATVTMLFTLKK